MPRGLGSFRRGFVRALRPTTLRHTGTRIEWDWRCYSTAPHHCISTFHLPTTHTHRPGLRHRITASHHHRTRTPVVGAQLGAGMSRSPSCSVSVAACARCQSRCAQSPRREESRLIASSVVSRRLSPRREESRVIASSVVSRRLSQSPRREKSRASPRLSSRVVCPLVVRRPAARCQSRRVRSLAALLCLSALCAVTASSGVSRHRVVCRVASCVSCRRASSRCSVSASVGLCARRVSRVPFSFSDSMDDVFFRPVLTRRVFFLF